MCEGRILWVIALLVVSGRAMGAVTIHVPADLPTIAQAVSLSSSGDAIIVSGGPYSEPLISVSSKALSIEASGAVTWNATAENAISAQSGAEVTVRGFTIRAGTSVAVGAAFGGTMIAEDCTLRDNARAGASAGAGGHVIIRRCAIFDNPPGGSPSLSHGGIRIDNAGTTVLVEDSDITGDKTSGLAYGISVHDGADAIVRGSTIVGPLYGINAQESGSTVVLTGTTFLDCTNAIRATTGGGVNAGDLSNVAADDNGLNVFYHSCPTFFRNESGGTARAEGNVFPRIDAGYLSSRVAGSVDTTPALHLAIDRVAVNQSPVLFASPEEAQLIELRLFSNAAVAASLEIGGWQVSDDPAFGAGNEGVFEFPAGTRIAVGESVLLAVNPAALDLGTPITPGTQVFDWSAVPQAISLGTAGDEVFLTSNPASIQDALLYGTADDTTAPEFWLGARRVLGPVGSVLGRDLSGTDTNTAPDWSLYHSGRQTASPVHGLMVR